jgi:REP element-mobilizing transposase RayT
VSKEKYRRLQSFSHGDKHYIFYFERKTMDVGGYKIRNQKEMHFVSFAVVGWVDVFTRKEYKDIVVENLKFCQKEKGLLLHGWCIMSNHVHLITSAKNENLSDILRDFKKFTSKQIFAAITKNETESRKECLPGR